MGAIPGAGDGMRADTAGISGRGAGNDGRAVVPAGVPVRVRGHGERDIRAGTGGERDHGRGEAFGDCVRAQPEGGGPVWHGDEGWRRGAGAPRREEGWRSGIRLGWIWDRQTTGPRWRWWSGRRRRGGGKGGAGDGGEVSGGGRGGEHARLDLATGGEAGGGDGGVGCGKVRAAE